jgi:glycolate oxidase
VGEKGALWQEPDLGLYEYDGGVDKARPDLVLFPRTAQQVAEILRYCTEHQLPVVARGAGTGLSGGAISRAGGVVVSLVRMNRILEMNLEDEYLKVQPGVVNLDLSVALAPHGYFYAPDPSSQRACTVGGNVAENAGGPHTLVYGVTTNHVFGVEYVTATGELLVAGGPESDLPGLDTRGLLIGSEGTLAVVTAVWVRILRAPEAVEALLAIYDDPEQAGQSVSDVIARGVLPIALEMMDGVMLRMVEEATHAGYPLDAAAVLLIELAGPAEEIREQLPLVAEICKSNGARTVRIAADAAERALLWKGRKNLLRAGWCGATLAPAQGAGLHPGSGAETRSHHQQHLSRGRWQPAPHHPVRRAQARRSGQSETGRGRNPGDLRRRRRHDYRRTWCGHGEE